MGKAPSDAVNCSLSWYGAPSILTARLRVAFLQIALVISIDSCCCDLFLGGAGWGAQWCRLGA